MAGGPRLRRPVHPRSRLLKQFEHIVKHYPDSEHHKAAKEHADLLAQMIKEDADHEKRAAKPFNKLSKKDQVAELIFQLRDQNGHQFYQPGACDIFDTPSGKEDSPAHKLVNIGYDAVPQLIEHLDNQRLTRSVGYHRNFYFSHHVLRVNDCALVILERIAGRTFWRASSTFSYMSKDKQADETKKKVQQWYDEFRKKGEKQLLIESVERADSDSHKQATRLREKYPDAAMTTILAGIKAAKESRTRDLLVAALTEIKGDGPVPFLLTEVKEGPYSYGRVVAARGLHERGRAEGVQAIIAEWKGQRPKPRLQPWQKKDEYDDSESSLGSVADFLANCGRVEAISAREKGLAKHSVNFRESVISTIHSGNLFSEFGTGRGRVLSPQEKKLRDDPKKVSAAIERLLIGALDDKEERVGMSGSWDDKSFSDPRICDLAGHVLHRRLPDKYAFDLSASEIERDRALFALKNVWRK